MLALGGEMPACLRTLKMWRNLHTWAMATEIFGQLQSRVGDDAILGPGELAAVHQLGLALTWERAWRRGAYYTDHERLLAALLRAKAQGPVRDHLRHWMKLRGCRRISSVQIEVARAGVPASLLGEMDSVGVRATATLGVGWLVGVWARGLAVVDGGFVLDIDVPGGRRMSTVTEDLDVRAVRWEADAEQPGRSRPCDAPARLERLGDGTWRLDWQDAPPTGRV